MCVCVCVVGEGISVSASADGLYVCARSHKHQHKPRSNFNTYHTRVCVIPLPTNPAHSPKNRNPVCWPPTWTATPGWRGLMTRSEEHSTRWNWVFFCQRANENTPHVCYAAEMNWIIGGCEFKCVFLDSNIDWYCSLIAQNILSIQLKCTLNVASGRLIWCAVCTFECELWLILSTAYDIDYCLRHLDRRQINCMFIQTCTQDTHTCRVGWWQILVNELCSINCAIQTKHTIYHI